MKIIEFVGARVQAAIWMVALLTAVVGPSMVAAQPAPLCPESTVRLIVPFPAGGPVDVVARLLVEPLRAAFGQTIIIENKVGGSGNLATGYVAQQPGNGCTVLISYDTHGVNPALYPNLPFDTLTAFRPVTLLGVLPLALVVNPAEPWKNMDDVVAAAKKLEGALSYASGGNATFGHLATKIVEQLYQIKLNHIPYRGGAPAVQGVLGGHVPMMMGSVTSLAPPTTDNRLRPILQTGAKRHAFFPDTPTLQELGHSDLELVSWIGIFLPASASPDLAQRLNTELRRIVIDNQIVADRLSSLGIQVVASSSDELQAWVKKEIVRWTRLVAIHGIKPE